MTDHEGTDHGGTDHGGTDHGGPGHTLFGTTLRERTAEATTNVRLRGALAGRPRASATTAPPRSTHWKTPTACEWRRERSKPM